MIRELIFRVQRLFGFKHEEPLLRLPEILGFYPRDWSYYQLAFTHSSASDVTDDGYRLNNERLEFLGDSVLSTAVSPPLYCVSSLGRRCTIKASLNACQESR